MRATVALVVTAGAGRQRRRRWQRGRGGVGERASTPPSGIVAAAGSGSPVHRRAPWRFRGWTSPPRRQRRRHGCRWPWTGWRHRRRRAVALTATGAARGGTGGGRQRLPPVPGAAAEYRAVCRPYLGKPRTVATAEWAGLGGTEFAERRSWVAPVAMGRRPGGTARQRSATAEPAAEFAAPGGRGGNWRPCAVTPGSRAPAATVRLAWRGAGGRGAPRRRRRTGGNGGVVLGSRGSAGPAVMARSAAGGVAALAGGRGRRCGWPRWRSSAATQGAKGATAVAGVAGALGRRAKVAVRHPWCRAGNRPSLGRQQRPRNR